MEAVSRTQRLRPNGEDGRAAPPILDCLPVEFYMRNDFLSYLSY